jgi:hypothetical protein
MLRTFREKTTLSYGYAVVDVVHTLLIHEQMVKTDREIYESFGIAGAEVPSTKATLGSRVNLFLTRMVRKAASGSDELKTELALRRLMKKGGRATFGGERAACRFGYQTGKVHGGHNFSRSPTRFWHEAPSMLRDVDMSGCYTTIISGMNVYWGRPIVHEPGNRSLTLREAVELLAGRCDPDAHGFALLFELLQEGLEYLALASLGGDEDPEVADLGLANPVVAAEPLLGPVGVRGQVVVGHAVGLAAPDRGGQRLQVPQGRDLGLELGDRPGRRRLLDHRFLDRLDLGLGGILQLVDVVGRVGRLADVGVETRTRPALEQFLLA